MLVLAVNSIGMPVSSIRLGGRIGEVSGILVDPTKMRIAAFWVQIGGKKQDEILLPEDIREFNVRGIIVDDLHNISEISELPKLEEILDIDYQIPGKKVVSGKSRIGTATDFSFNPETGQITTIIGKPSITRRLGLTEFTISRSQITEVNDKQIQVKDGAELAPTRRQSEASKI